jgi:hypothetical protein
VRTSTLAAAAALSVSLITPVSSKDDPSPLTTMDYVALRQLAARHAWALDSGADNGYAFAEAPVDQWALVGRRGGAPTSIGGRYEDAYVRTSAGWRFKDREFVPARSGARADATCKAAYSATIPPRAFEAPKPDNQNRSALSALDDLEIEQLVSSYGHALDSGFCQGDNGAAYAGLFAPDGISYTRDRPCQGEQLYQLARDQPHGPDYLRHFLTNHVIEPSPDRATGKEYLVVLDIGQNGQPGSVYLGGHYEDVYVKTPDGWRFKTRRSFGSVSGPL